MVDDGSTDASGAICDAWAVRDDRVKVYHKPNGGLSDARNFGIDRASGEMLMFVDSDDYVSEHIVEVLFDLVRDSGAQVAICDPAHVFGEDWATFECIGSPIDYAPHEAIKEMLYQTSFLTAAWGKLYAASCFDGIRFPVGVLFEDSAVMYRVLETAEKVSYTQSRLYAYCHRDNSITTRAFDTCDLNIWEICKQIESHYIESGSDLVCAARSYRMSAALRIYLNAPQGSYVDEVAECEEWIRSNSRQVISDSHVRCKTKFALFLFVVCKPLMRFVYGLIDRWS